MEDTFNDGLYNTYKFIMKNIKQEQKFKVYCSTNINKSVDKQLVETLVTNNEPLILEAVASSNSVDLDGDYMTNECLEDMKNQAVGLNIFLDHEHTIDKIVGSVVEVIETSSDIFKVKFSVLPKYEWYITDLLENGINLGLSIGASVLDFEESDTGWKINKVKLVEISIVGIPANWDTFGTVQTSKELGMVTAKCFNGACKQIIDNLSLQKDLVLKEFEDGEDPDEDGVITEEEVIKLINEAIIKAKDQIITEIVSEYHLDGKQTVPDDAPSEAVDQSTNSSDDEDKEKNLDMEKEEIVELIKEHSLTIDTIKEVIVETLKEVKEAEAEVTMETPIEKEEEVEVTDVDEEIEVKEVEDVELEKSTDEEVEKEEVELEKSSEDVEDVEKSSETDVGVTVETFDMEELKKSIKEELRAEVEAEVEEELLKALSTERKPVAHEQPKVEEVEKEAADEEKIEKSGNVMTTRKMAEHLLK